MFISFLNGCICTERREKNQKHRSIRHRIADDGVVLSFSKHLYFTFKSFEYVWYRLALEAQHVRIMKMHVLCIRLVICVERLQHISDYASFSTVAIQLVMPCVMARHQQIQTAEEKTEIELNLKTLVVVQMSGENDECQF